MRKLVVVLLCFASFVCLSGCGEYAIPSKDTTDVPAETEEVAKAVLFLVSEEASFITGDILRVESRGRSYTLELAFILRLNIIKNL